MEIIQCIYYIHILGICIHARLYSHFKVSIYILKIILILYIEKKGLYHRALLLYMSV